jgi:DNA-binding NtrC family response regulator
VLENREVRAVGASRSRKVNVRVLFATHVDLRHAVNNGRFREDLYFRMAQVRVEVPPLRRRLADMRVLVEEMLEGLGRKDLVLDTAGMSALLAQSWPGNVRQLRTIIETAKVESDGARLMIERALAANAPEDEPRPAWRAYNQAVKEFERQYYAQLLERFGSNVTKIAEAAGTTRLTARSKLREFGLRR